MFQKHWKEIIVTKFVWILCVFKWKDLPCALYICYPENSEYVLLIFSFGSLIFHGFAKGRGVIGNILFKNKSLGYKTMPALFFLVCRRLVRIYVIRDETLYDDFILHS